MPIITTATDTPSTRSIAIGDLKFIVILRKVPSYLTSRLRNRQLRLLARQNEDNRFSPQVRVRFAIRSGSRKTSGVRRSQPPSELLRVPLQNGMASICVAESRFAV